MKTITIQLDGKTEEFQIPRGNFIYITDEQGKRAGRIDRAIGMICRNQNCGKQIQAQQWVYSKCTANLHRGYYHLDCAKKLGLVD